jgi:hypothetical protein
MARRFYRIRVGGILGNRFATAFDAFEIEREQGCTVLSGVCVDSSAVFGVLERVKALGLDLLDVQSYAIAPLRETSAAESRHSGGTSISRSDEGR